MIYVCDSIMGSGKSQAAINYMNEHPDKRFVYITPYLDEADRIIESCPKLHFEAPLFTKQGNKTAYARRFLLKGTNIASTHNAFKNYTKDMLDSIRDKKYTLFIDENMDVLESCDILFSDIELLCGGGYIRYNSEEKVYEATGKEYERGRFLDVMWLFQSRQIARVDEYNKATGKYMRLFFWKLPKDLIEAFEDVYILTYLFEGQSLYYFTRISKLKYKDIGVEPADTPEGYRFIDHPGVVPEYAKHLREMVEVLDDRKLNEVGRTRTALSKDWYRRNGKTVVPRVKKNVYNIFNHFWRDECASDERMWSTYKSARDKVKGKGYAKGFASMNLRATNAYRGKTHLAYVCNVFPNVDEKLFYESLGFKYNDDLFALSTLIQWIWRSAIRDGKPIKIYLPSERMRNLLIGWMDSLAEGGEADEGEAV